MARRKPISPLQQIVGYFMVAPLPELQAAVDAIHAIVDSRRQQAAAAPPASVAPVRTRVRPAVARPAGTAPRPRRRRNVTPAATTPAEQAAQPSVAEPPAVAHNGPVRRRRPAVAPAGATVTIPDLPAQGTPEDFEE